MTTIISPENGFQPFRCRVGISSQVFQKDKYIYKISARNSVARAKKDYARLRVLLSRIGCGHKLQQSDIFPCIVNGSSATCVKQEIINGITIAQFGKSNLINHLKKNKSDALFLSRMIEIFFESIKSQKLYPDLVGNPENQALWKSINLMVDGRGIILCDVGLSPHQDTMRIHGKRFFNSVNVQHYKSKMEEARRLLRAI